MIVEKIDKDLRVTSIKNNNPAVYFDGTADFGGLGIGHSPTELLCSAVSSCMLIMMGKKAMELGLEISDFESSYKYSYKEGPEINRIILNIKTPHLSEKEKSLLLDEAHKCPIHKALNPSIEFTLNLI